LAGVPRAGPWEAVDLAEVPVAADRNGRPFRAFPGRVEERVPALFGRCEAARLHVFTGQRLGNGEVMGRQVVVVLYVLALVAVVVGVDVLFFRDHAWERLTVNVGIVLVFAAFYFRFLRLF